jgi:hypothetical protein
MYVYSFTVYVVLLTVLFGLLAVTVLAVFAVAGIYCVVVRHHGLSLLVFA